ANGLILTILKNIRPGTPETKLSSELGLQRCFGALWALVFPHSCNINLSLAVMSSHTSHRTLELAEHLPFSASLEEEIRQLMSWEVDRMWEDRDFLRLTVQRAMLDPKVARFTRLVGPARLAKAIAERLRHYRNKRVLDDDDIEAASNAISALCFVFGFMRPAVLGYHRKETKRVAENVAKIIARGLQ
ncbi:MAG: hypothetical protein DMG96_41950, partial [Acidobacteria bacterium]